MLQVKALTTRRFFQIVLALSEYLHFKKDIIYDFCICSVGEIIYSENNQPLSHLVSLQVHKSATIRVIGAPEK